MRTVEEAVSDQPVLALAAAAGVGFVLGGGLPPGVLTLLLGAGARMAGAWLQQELLDRTHPQETHQ